MEGYKITNYQKKILELLTISERKKIELICEPKKSFRKKQQAKITCYLFGVHQIRGVTYQNYCIDLNLKRTKKDAVLGTWQQLRGINTQSNVHRKTTEEKKAHQKFC